MSDHVKAIHSRYAVTLYAEHAIRCSLKSTGIYSGFCSCLRDLMAASSHVSLKPNRKEWLRRVAEGPVVVECNQLHHTKQGIPIKGISAD